MQGGRLLIAAQQAPALSSVSLGGGCPHSHPLCLCLTATCPFSFLSPTCRSELFKYYHERLPSGFPFPPLPAWKAGDSPEHEEEEEVEGSTWQEDPHVEKHHDDVIGEQVIGRLWGGQGWAD